MNNQEYQENLENVLEKYGRDITEASRNGKIDPVIGRDDEIRSVMRILSRKTKNNPVFFAPRQTVGERLNAINIVAAVREDGCLYVKKKQGGEKICLFASFVFNVFSTFARIFLE